MKKYSSLLLTIFLTLVVLVALNSILKNGQTYIGQEYYDSNDIQSMKHDYLTNLEKYVLNPPNKEKTIENLNVSSEEINYYRYYYGDMDAQILNIMDQYDYKIAVQQDSEIVNDALIEELLTERDTKISSIRQNFADDVAITEKILAVKKQAVEDYFREHEQNKQQFENSRSMFGYSLTNQETGEKLDKDAKNYTRTFNVFFPYYVEQEETYISDANSEVGIMNEEPIRIVSERTKYDGDVYLLENAFEISENNWDYDRFYYAKYTSYILWLVGLVALLALCTKARWKKAHFEQLQLLFKWFVSKPQDVLMIGAILVGYILLNVIDESSYIITNFTYNYGYISITNVAELIVRLLIYSILLALFALFLYLIIQNFKSTPVHVLWEKSISKKIVHIVQGLFLNRSIAIQTFAMFIVFYLGGIGFVIATQGSQQIVIYTLLFIFVLVPVLIVYLARMSTLNRVMKQTELMAEGKTVEPIVVKGKSPIANHARNLNALQEGVKKSVYEQAKSERLKTELITNVSHDLRTPLTSIITYTDLLKNPHLSPEDRASYVNVLDRKADRLKVLIEDLFEVSKMASGNIELTKQRVDIAQLIQQIAGEYITDFEEVGLDLRTTISQQPLFAEVDGQKLWRVCENLLNNAKKYSLKGTRVYMQLSELNNEAILTLKNVSHYELEGEAGELTERFKRADLARHTEGSGLGLAIAASIVELHNGSLAIEADGDLFKVTVKIPC